jgi:hypothetical protein
MQCFDGIIVGFKNGSAKLLRGRKVASISAQLMTTSRKEASFFGKARHGPSPNFCFEFRREPGKGKAPRLGDGVMELQASFRSCDVVGGRHVATLLASAAAHMIPRCELFLVCWGLKISQSCRYGP